MNNLNSSILTLSLVRQVAGGVCRDSTCLQTDLGTLGAETEEGASVAGGAVVQLCQLSALSSTPLAGHDLSQTRSATHHQLQGRSLISSQTPSQGFYQLCSYCIVVMLGVRSS